MWSLMNWRDFCGRDYADVKKYWIERMGASGNRGSLLFPCEGRTYSPPASGRWYCLRQPCALRGGHAGSAEPSRRRTKKECAIPPHIPFSPGGVCFRLCAVESMGTGLGYDEVGYNLAIER